MKLDRFALAVALVVAVAAGLTQVARGASQVLIYVMPPVLGVTAYVLVTRQRRASTPALIHRQYFVYSTTREAGPTLDAITQALDARGYQTVSVRIDDADGELGPAGPERISQAQFRVRDRRAPAGAGQLYVRVRKQDSGKLAGLVESDDDGPGFYDEMAQMTVVALSRLLDGFEWAPDGMTRWPIRELEKTLPERPLGLGILGLG